MKVDDFVDHRGHALDRQRDESGVTSLRLEFCEISGSHLGAFTGDLELPILMDRSFDSGREIECLPSLETFDVFEHVPRVRLGR